MLREFPLINNKKYTLPRDQFFILSQQRIEDSTIQRDMFFF